MKKLFFAAAVAVAFLSAPQARAQSAKIANTSAAPDEWGQAGQPTLPATDDAMMHSSGVLVAPGMSSSPYRGPSTDYNGRPVARRKSYRPRSVRASAADPAMASSGVMLAPGINTAPYRGVSTDYNGRPVRPAARPGAVAQPAANSSVAANW